MPNPTPPNVPKSGDGPTPRPTIAPKGALSNFAETPFKIDGTHFGSVEAFVQFIKYPPDSLSRGALNKMEHGPEAKRQGREANRWIDKAVQRGKVAFVYWVGTEIPFGSTDHHKLISRAIRAKFKVTPEARVALLATGDAELKIDHRERGNTSLPGKIFCKILESLREEIRRDPWAWTGGKSDGGSVHAFANSLDQLSLTISPRADVAAGQIRSGETLSNARAASEINKQIPVISNADIVELVRSFPIPDRQPVMECLYAATRYTNLNGLNRLHLVVERIAGRKHEVYAPGTTTVADSLRFLQDRRLFKQFKKMKFESELKPESVVILDDPILRRIEHDPRFAKDLVKNRAILINIEGYESGIRMFDCQNASELRRAIVPIYQGACKFFRDAEGQMSFSDAVAAKLNDTVHRRLARAEEVHGFNGQLFELVVTVAPKRHLEPSLKVFDGELNDRSLLNESQMAKILRWQDDPDAARELLVQTMQVFSLRRLGEIAQKLHRRIQSDLSETPFSFDDIRFLVVNPRKSFGLMNMIYRQSNELPAELFINKQDSYLASPGICVVVDDFAGTGDSMRADYAWLRRHAHPEMRIVLAPFVSSRHARDNVFGPIMAQDSKLHYVAGEIVKSLADSDFAVSLAEQPDLLRRVLVASGGLGYQNNGFAVAFPHGCPNNNHLLGAKAANCFSLNEEGAKIHKNGT